MSLAAIVASFASLGLPGLAQFVSDVQIFVGAFAVYPVLVVISLAGMVLLAALFLRMLRRVFLGPLNERWSGMRDLSRVEIAVMVALLVPTAIIGIYPAWLINVIDATAKAVVSR